MKTCWIKAQAPRRVALRSVTDIVRWLEGLVQIPGADPWPAA